MSNVSLSVLKWKIGRQNGSLQQDYEDYVNPQGFGDASFEIDEVRLEFSWGHIDTTPFLIAALKGACDEDCEKRKPVDVWKAVSEKRRTRRKDWGDAPEDYTPAMIVGTLGAAGVMAIPAAAAGGGL